MLTVVASRRSAAAPAQEPEAARPGREWRRLLPFLAVGTIALVVRLLHIDHLVFIDELNHILAARTYLETGTMAIPGGAPYLRAQAFTHLLAVMFRIWGESLIAARIPAALAGTGLVVLLFGWVRSAAGAPAAWVAAMLLCFDPYSLFLSQVARFYTLHALAFWLAVVGAWHLLEGRWRGWTAAIAVVAILVALEVASHLTPLTAIGKLGLACGALLVASPRLLAWAQERRAHMLLAGPVLLALGAMAAAWWLSGVGPEAWRLFNHADGWAVDQRENLRYYHEQLSIRYGTLWSLLPLISVVALLIRPRLTLFCGGLFAVPMVVHSFAAWKELRYVFYVMPALFAIIGVAAGAAGTWLHRQLQDGLHSRYGRVIPDSLVTAALVALLLVTVRFGWNTNLAFAEAKEIVTSRPPYRPGPFSWTSSDWDGARPYLQPWLDGGAVVVASANLKSIYSLGRLDYEIAAEQLGGARGNPEFTIVWKTGRPAVSRPESLATIVACHETGLVIVENMHWAADWAVPASVAEYLVRELHPIELPTELHLRAYGWRRPGTAPLPDRCPPQVGGGA